jgi:RNA pol II promoter Fmp27 protein domain
MSLSLSSSIHGTGATPSSLYLSPNTFSHFWSWVGLFDGALSPPIRQGSYYPQKLRTPKFGRHLATLKYRIALARVYIQHAYIDDSRESWVDGITPFVGVKALIDGFQADMHQRDQETSVPGLIPDTVKVVRRKSMYAAEMVLKGLDLRAMLATFKEPLKQSVPLSPQSQPNNYRTRNRLSAVPLSSPWIDMDDFIETDWFPSVKPRVYLLPIVTCPRLTYFHRNHEDIGNVVEYSKFGAEDSHVCFLGKEECKHMTHISPSYCSCLNEAVLQVQMSLALARISQLRDEIKSDGNAGKNVDLGESSEKVR